MAGRSLYHFVSWEAVARQPTSLCRTLIDCKTYHSPGTATTWLSTVHAPLSLRARLRHFPCQPLAWFFISLIEEQNSPTRSGSDDDSIIGASLRSYVHATTRPEEKTTFPVPKSRGGARCSF